MKINVAKTKQKTMGLMKSNKTGPETQNNDLVTVELETRDRVSSLLNAHVSMTVQSILSIDQSALQYTVLMELDFKYRLDEFLQVFQGFQKGKKEKLIEAENVRIPFIVTNTTDTNVLNETHFFREVEGDSTCSMYGDFDNVVQEAPTDLNSAKSFMKCEKYVMAITMGYHTIQRHIPFNQVYLFIKIATDGRPGTEMTRFVFDHGDSSFAGFSRAIYGFKPIDAGPTIQEIDIGHSYDGVYPRVYVSMRYGHIPWEALVKFYAIPCLIFILLVVDRIDDTASLLGLSATLILANIALLFVTESAGTMTYQEISVVLNTLSLVLCTLYLRIYQEEILDFRRTAILSISLNVAMNFVIVILQLIFAKLQQKRVDSLIKSKDFATASKTLAVI